MKSLHVRFLAALLLLAGGISAPAHGEAPPTSSPAAEVTFGLVRAGIPVPKYLFTVHEDGTGTYAGEELPLTAIQTISAESASQSAHAARQGSEAFSQPITLSPATVHRIFALAHALKEFNTTCASKAKNVADTGTKTLSYRDRSTTGSCTYNFSENKNVIQLTDLFYGMAETMDEGRRLEHLHRFDRLGLDAAMAFLAQEVTEGRALELGSIAGTLRSLAGDTDLMQRVRVRASQLLSLLPADLQTATP